MVIFEGAPNYPTPDRIWQIVEKQKVSTLGISPTAIRALCAQPEKGMGRQTRLLQPASARPYRRALG
ncbi:MAG: hypothetical protein R3C24_05160 [Cyanobacteriota/Melainabacteria group bacterium]